MCALKTVPMLDLSSLILCKPQTVLLSATLAGGEVRRDNGSLAGYVRGDDTYNVKGMKVGYVVGDAVRRANGSLAFYVVDRNATSEMKGAPGLILRSCLVPVCLAPPECPTPEFF